MSQYVLIRVATKKDKKDLAALKNLMIESVSGKRLSDIEKKVVFDFFKKWNGEKPLYLVAEIDNITAGCIGASFFTGHRSTENPTGLYAIIHDASVLENYRGKGIGTELLKGILIECKKREVGRISLYPSNLGKPMYEYFGFTEEKNNYPEMKLYYKDLKKLKLRYRKGS